MKPIEQQLREWLKRHSCDPNVGVKAWNELFALLAQPTGDAAPQQHGVNCPKIEHTGSGYLHDAKDDSPYDVDGVLYCGRCHHWIEAIHPLEDKDTCAWCGGVRPTVCQKCAADAAQQRDREWCSKLAEYDIAALAEYPGGIKITMPDAVAAERERCAKIMCVLCLRGIPTHIHEGKIIHEDPAGYEPCKASAIRATGTPEPPAIGVAYGPISDKQKEYIYRGELPPAPAPSPEQENVQLRVEAALLIDRILSGFSSHDIAIDCVLEAFAKVREAVERDLRERVESLEAQLHDLREAKK